jgi:sulfate-transporting ATPase
MATTAPAESNKVIYSMTGVTKAHDKKVVLKDIYLSYFYGAKIGVLGLNGSGKSSLLKILAGVDKQYDGQISLAPGYTIGYLEQEPHLTAGKTVKQCVEEGVKKTLDLLAEYERINEKFAEPMSDDAMTALLEKQGSVQEKLDAANAWDLDAQLEMAMDALRCPPADAVVDNLSGGERRRVALVRLLLTKPDVLILDEPTNHLDAETVEWLEQHLKRYEGTVIAVTHDRYFLDNVAGWILELDRGHGIPFKGNYTSWLEQKKGRMEIEEKQASARQKALARELEWVRQGAKARVAKSKARLAKYEEMVAQDQRETEKNVEIFIPPGPRLGSKVIDAKQLTKAFGDKLLLSSVDFSLPPNAIVGIIGPNGAGKTTLFRMITGHERPDGVHRQRPAAEGRHAQRRRAEPRPPGPDDEDGRQRPAAGRADQRLRRERHPGAGGGAGELRRLRDRDQPRPLVPGPAGHAHPGLRGR